MSAITTHVLDTARGRPAAGIPIELARLAGDEREVLRRTTTNADGRTDEPLLSGEELTRGVYELGFDVGEYFAGQPEAGSADPPFLDRVPIRHRRPAGPLPRTATGLPLVLRHLPRELR